MSSLEGLDKLNRRLNAIAEGRELLKGVQIDTVRRGKETAPRKTGDYSRGIIPGALADDHAIVRAIAPHSAVVEFGSKPHIIRPRNKSVLAWPATAAGRRLSGRARASTRRGKNGGMIIAHLVHHPGTRPTHNLVNAAKWALGKVGISKIIEQWNRAA